MRLLTKGTRNVLAAAAVVLLLSPTATYAKAKAKAKEKAAPAAAATAPVDLNSASAKDLEALPGVGAATAKKIVANRPYSSVADLSKAGVSAKTIDKLKPLVTVGASPVPAAETKKASSEPKASKSEKKTEKKSEAKAASAAPAAAGPVDLNNASEKDLEALPAVGAATAKKIIAGRPYSSVGDLSKAGVSKKTIEKISPLVTVGAAAAAPAAKAAPAPAPSRTSAPRAAAPSAPPAKTAASAPASDVVAQTPPSKGMVWVNTATKVFHREGDPWYGKTKHGKFMTEADAVAAGNHESKEKMKKQ
jgi:competence protein ComEA